MNTQKGASEVIVVTLIIVVTVIIAGIFFAWIKESSKTKMDQTSTELAQASDLSCMNAEFVVDSCNINSTTKITKILFTNNSELKLFNLVLTIEGQSNDTENMVLIGTFDRVVNPGEIVELSTDANFTYSREDLEYTELDVNSITHMILTNGTCPKDSIVLSCEVE